LKAPPPLKFDRDVETFVTRCLKTQNPGFYQEAIQKLVPHGINASFVGRNVWEGNGTAVELNMKCSYRGAKIPVQGHPDD
jgi:hypothetical protein